MEQYLPRKWIADANWPRRIGFKAVFAPEPQVPACAPLFYHYDIQTWHRLGREPVPIQCREKLDAIALWNNPRGLPLSSTIPDSPALARIVPYTPPSDPGGVPPCAVQLVLPTGSVARLHEDLNLPISQLTSPPRL